ncbi:MAG TPA: cysteine desulfurase-like protein [Thermoanaerobaculaceae bacterium]|nr:cysteine desulfurase-like protein [Thermoanaerobaculaceae bacterium]
MAFGESECARCRGDFPALGRALGGSPLAFFDGPAGTQLPRAVIDAVSGYYATCNANTHGQFVTSRESDAMLAGARETVAAFLGARSWREVSFGANMTSLAYALARALARRFGPGDEVVITALDHEANRGPWLTLAERGVTVREVALRRDGTLDPDDMARRVGPRTRLLAIGYASNALGTVNDLALARRLAREAGAWLLVDAVHAAPHFPIDFAALDADFLLCSAYKFYAPHVGILLARPGLLDELEPDRLRTQDQAAPYRIETGTANHAAIAGVKAAVEYLASWGAGGSLRERLVGAMEAIAAWEHALARRYFDALRAAPGVTVWGPDFASPRRAPTVSITIDGMTATEAARLLGERGLLVWDGHFYAVRAMEALGLDARGGVLRAGMSMYTTPAEVDRLAGAVAALAASRNDQSR